MVAQAIAVPLAGAFIAVACVWIAVQQTRMAKRRLAQELFDRRFRVFATARSLIEEVVAFRSATQEMLRQYFLGIADAPFLFDRDLVAYLDRLGDDASLVSVLGGSGEDAYRQVSDAIDRVAAAREDLLARFEPFLRLR